MGDNITKFYLLDERTGWRTAEKQYLSFSKEKQGICLNKVPKKDAIGAFAGLDIPTGFALDYYGNIYIVDTKGNVILKYDLCREFPSPLLCLGGEGKGPREFDSPIGIAVSPSGNLYISDSKNHRIQVFSIKGLVLRDIWGKTNANGEPVHGDGNGEFNQPWDIAIDSQENVYVVDKGNNRVQKFSKAGTFIVSFGSFEPGKLSNPEHIAIDTQDRIYVMDKKDKVQVFSTDGQHLEGKQLRSEVTEDFAAPVIWVDAVGRIHYTLNEKVLRMFHGQGRFFKRAPGRRRQSEGIIPGVFYKDDKLVFTTENLPEPVDDVTEYEKEGTFYTEALDSQVYKCQWHKIILDAEIPVGTSIMVDTYTSSSEKDFLEIKALSDHLWLTRQLNAKDFLVQSLPGRYLWLRITIKGNGKETPIIKNIKVFYPRVSYLQYLPALYQQEPTSKWFLERFLSIFEHFFAGFEEEIAGISRYFKPGAVEKEFLPWLGSWLGLVLEEQLPEQIKRELIKQAHQLFKMRGTLKGLQMVLEIYTGRKFPILEHFKMRQWLILGEKAVLGGNSYLWGKDASLGESTELGKFQLASSLELPPDPFQTPAHRFTVIIPYNYCSTGEEERIITRVVELWKPAHTQFFLRKAKPKLRVGLQSMIGADTIIAKYPQAVLARTSRLGKDSILTGSPGEGEAPNFVLNSGTRLNKESVID
jgi:phage tail-like protein